MDSQLPPEANPAPVETQNASQGNRVPRLPTASQPKKATSRRPGDLRAADYLQDMHRIGAISYSPQYKRRYATVNISDLFASLVEIYTIWFTSVWPKINRMVEQYPVPLGIENSIVYLSRCYISSWFLDLYAHIRKAVINVDSISLTQYFNPIFYPSTIIYDHFLSRLASSIKPTKIFNSVAEELYIPILRENPPMDQDNPFNINHFILNKDLVLATNQIMMNNRLCRLTPISSDPIGNPSWLFDWHMINSQRHAFAWFPQEGNYSAEDIAIAYIIGRALTPKMGPVDVDSWQWIPPGIDHNTCTAANFHRVDRRRFSGCCEHTTLEKQMNVVLPHFYESDPDKFMVYNKGPLAYPMEGILSPSSSKSKKRKTTVIVDEETEPEDEAHPATIPSAIVSPTTPEIRTTSRVRLLTYCYHREVLKWPEQSTRIGAHRYFISE